LNSVFIRYPVQVTLLANTSVMVSHRDENEEGLMTIWSPVGQFSSMFNPPHFHP
jgi:hypothetical protein